jgi:hypothetical protein
VHPHIVVATPESFSEKVISNEQLKKNSFDNINYLGNIWE